MQTVGTPGQGEAAGRLKGGKYLLGDGVMILSPGRTNGARDHTPYKSKSDIPSQRDARAVQQCIFTRAGRSDDENKHTAPPISAGQLCQGWTANATISGAPSALRTVGHPRARFIR